MQTQTPEEKLLHEKTRKFLLWLGIGSMIMAFAGITSAYMVSRDSRGWMLFELPGIFFISTAIIILSSVTMNLATSAVKKDDINGVKRYLLLTLLLGIGFV